MFDITKDYIDRLAKNDQIKPEQAFKCLPSVKKSSVLTAGVRFLIDTMAMAEHFFKPDQIPVSDGMFDPPAGLDSWLDENSRYAAYQTYQLWSEYFTGCGAKYFKGSTDDYNPPVALDHATEIARTYLAMSLQNLIGQARNFSHAYRAQLESLKYRLTQVLTTGYGSFNWEPGEDLEILSLIGADRPVSPQNIIRACMSYLAMDRDVTPKLAGVVNMDAAITTVPGYEKLAESLQANKSIDIMCLFLDDKFKPVWSNWIAVTSIPELVTNWLAWCQDHNQNPNAILMINQIYGEQKKG